MMIFKMCLFLWALITCKIKPTLIIIHFLCHVVLMQHSEVQPETSVSMSVNLTKALNNNPPGKNLPS